jgi:N-methylhydantoinase A
MVDMHTIGAGGGSIAQVDAGGLLLVGPESAGADPGPACYGKGGKRPTVTDANVVLGRLLPQSFLGGKMQLDKDAAFIAVQTIADALSVDPGSSEAPASVVSAEQAAQGIIDVVNDHMVRALRVMSVERGEDPKDFTLVSFGGAGGLHVCALAEELEMTKALVPVNAGVLSALGMLAADASRERSRTINKCVKDCDVESIEKIFEELVAQAKEELNPEGIPSFRRMPESTPIDTRLTVDVRYQGQSNTLNLPWQGLQTIEQAFHQKHEDSYGHWLDIDVELVNVRVRVVEEREVFVLPEWSASEENKQAFTIMAGIDEDVAVIDRSGLEVGQRIFGPALIVETSSTTWLAEGWCGEVDGVGNMRLVKE